MTREEAIKILEPIMFLDNEKDEAIQTAIESLKNKQGEWIIEKDGTYSNSLFTAYCSNCRHYVNWFEDNYGMAIIRELPNYCSNCGADMHNIFIKFNS